MASEIFGIVAPDFLIANPQDKLCGETEELGETGTGTERAVLGERGMLHTEGGWPKEINCNEPSQVNRFLSKIEKEEFFLSQVHELAIKAEKKVKESIAVNIYEEYFDYKDVATEEKEDQMITKCVFQDPIKASRNMVECRLFRINQN